MKQQDRLEEREQDIEEQLYKLESDKRLVEVRGASPRRRSPWGTPPPAPGVSGFWGGQRAWSWLAWRNWFCSTRCLHFGPGRHTFWGTKCVWGCPTAPWVLGARTEAVLTYQTLHPQLNTAFPGLPASSQVGGKGLEVQIPVSP